MQQAAHFIGCGHALLNLQRAGIALRLQMQQCMLEQTRQLRQGLEAHGAGAACQGMRQRDRVVGNDGSRLLRPLLQHLTQSL